MSYDRDMMYAINQDALSRVPKAKPDPKDATIAALTEQRDALKGEVERLATALDRGRSRLADFPNFLEQNGHRALSKIVAEINIDARAAASGAGGLLRRLGLTLAALLLGSSLYAAPAPHKPRHVTKFISTITVKVVAQVDFLRGAPAGQRGPWRITTADIDGCTAWVDDSAPDVTAAELLALRACRMKIDMAVDAAHDRAEKGGRP